MVIFISDIFLKHGKAKTWRIEKQALITIPPFILPQNHYLETLWKWKKMTNDQKQMIKWSKLLKVLFVEWQWSNALYLAVLSGSLCCGLGKGIHVHVCTRLESSVGKEWWLYIFVLHLVKLTKPIRHKESHVLAYISS